MSRFAIVMLVVVVAIVVAIGTGIEWAPSYLKHRASIQKSGLNDNPEVRRQLLRMFAIVCGSRTIQLVLFGIAALAKPSILGWLLIIVIFGSSVLAYMSSNTTRKKLLQVGQ